MIGINGISHFERGSRRQKLLFCDLNLRVEAHERIGILGLPGSGKTTLARVLTGAVTPDFGSVVRQSNLSWPLNYAALLHPELPPFANVWNVAQAHFLDRDVVVAKTETMLGHALNKEQPVGRMTPAQKLYLQVALTLALPFDVILADELPTLTDAGFRDRVTAHLTNGATAPGLIMLTRHAHLIAKHCTRAFVLFQGQLTPCVQVDQAADILVLLEEREHELASLET